MSPISPPCPVDKIRSELYISEMGPGGWQAMQDEKCAAKRSWSNKSLARARFPAPVPTHSSAGVLAPGPSMDIQTAPVHSLPYMTPTHLNRPPVPSASTSWCTHEHRSFPRQAPLSRPHSHPSSSGCTSSPKTARYSKCLPQSLGRATCWSPRRSSRRRDPSGSQAGFGDWPLAEYPHILWSAVPPRP